MSELTCPSCGEDSGVQWGDYGALGKTVPCAACGASCIVEYDEIWTGEEDYQSFWLTRADANSVGQG